MADRGKQAPVIVVKKKGGHGGHHGGAWKVAYADFVTAMMAFFMVMWIVAQSQKVKQNVAGYFTDPAAYAAKVASGVLDGGDGVLAQSGSAVTEAVVTLEERRERETLERAGDEIRAAMVEVPALRDLAGQVEVEITRDGLRVQLMEGPQETFFDVGSARLSVRGVQALTAVARVIAALPMTVVVEGHTDNRPFGGPSYTNWELSADRANAARRLLEQNGVGRWRIAEIRGYADTLLRFPENPEDPRNRRISVLVVGRFHAQPPQAAEPPSPLPGQDGPSH